MAAQASRRIVLILAGVAAAMPAPPSPSAQPDQVGLLFAEFMELRDQLDAVTEEISRYWSRGLSTLSAAEAAHHESLLDTEEEIAPDVLRVLAALTATPASTPLNVWQKLSVLGRQRGEAEACVKRGGPGAHLWCSTFAAGDGCDGMLESILADAERVLKRP